MVNPHYGARTMCVFCHVFIPREFQGVVEPLTEPEFDKLHFSRTPTTRKPDFECVPQRSAPRMASSPVSSLSAVCLPLPQPRWHARRLTA